MENGLAEWYTDTLDNLVFPFLHGIKFYEFLHNLKVPPANFSYMEEYFESVSNFSTKFAIFLEELNQVLNATDVKNVIEKHTLTLLQWRLRDRVRKSKEEDVDVNSFSPNLGWAITDADTLKQMLNSGYVLKHRWLKALQILDQIMTIDPKVRNSSYHMRLALATSLTMSTPVRSLASEDNTIDPLLRYLSFAKCVEEEKFFPVHTTLSTWLLRYVVASWAEEEELEWARNNILPEFKFPNKVGEATHKMVHYKPTNYNGISIHDGSIYYDYKPCTLQILAEYGAVCGGISKFGVSMAQAFGIPACPIGQPGHCAFLWWTEGDWVMSNGCSGITESKSHSGIQWTWNKRCDYQLLLDKAQQEFEKYSYSEQLRWTVKIVDDCMIKLELLEEAIEVCPYNYLAWRDFVNFTMGKIESLIKKDENFEKKVKLWCKEKFGILNSEDCDDISTFSQVTSSVEENVKNLTDRTDSEWYCSDKEAWIELDFGEIVTVSNIEIKWWGISFAGKYSVLAAEGNQYKKERCESDAETGPKSRSQYNAWSKLPGWDTPTRKIKIIFSEGHIDPWGMNVMIGIRQLNVYGETTSCGGVGEDVKSCLKRMICSNFVDFRMIGEDLLKELQPKGILLSSHCRITSSVPERIDNLVDGTGSEWYCRENEAWIELDLGKFCTIYSVSIKWWGISFAKQYTISVAVDDGDNVHYEVVKTEKDATEGPKTTCDYNRWSCLRGWSTPTRKIKLILNDGCLDPWGKNVWIGLRQIVIKGCEV